MIVNTHSNHIVNVQQDLLQRDSSSNHTNTRRSNVKCLMEAACALASMNKDAATTHPSRRDEDRVSSVSLTSDDEHQETYEHGTTSGSARSVTEKKEKREKTSSSAKSFPTKLMDILERDDTSESIAWLPNEKSFVVVCQKRFTLEVFPRFFKRCEFSSFARKLYWWGFKKISRGEGTDAFYHDLFQRGNHSLCANICGGKANGVTSKNTKSRRKNAPTGSESVAGKGREEIHGSCTSIEMYLSNRNMKSSLCGRSPIDRIGIQSPDDAYLVTKLPSMMDWKFSDSRNSTEHRASSLSSTSYRNNQCSRSIDQSCLPLSHMKPSVGCDMSNMAILELLKRDTVRLQHELEQVEAFSLIHSAHWQRRQQVVMLP